MGLIIKPLGAFDCHCCKGGWHMTWEAVVRCQRRAAIASTAKDEQ